jgi:hypothetical protein
MNKPVHVGLLRLVDSAPVIVALAAGLFRAQGIDVRISIEPSWANIADKLTYGVPVRRQGLGRRQPVCFGPCCWRRRAANGGSARNRRVAESSG